MLLKIIITKGVVGRHESDAADTATVAVDALGAAIQGEEAAGVVHHCKMKQHLHRGFAWRQPAAALAVCKRAVVGGASSAGR